VRLARAIGVAPHDFLLAAVLATPEEPLFAREDAWAYVLARVAALQEGQAASAGEQHGEGELEDQPTTDALQGAVRALLEGARTADLTEHQ
jgi:hypothetical protein